MGNRFTGTRLDLQSLVDLLIDYIYSSCDTRSLGEAYGLSPSEICRKAQRYHLPPRRPRQRNIRSQTDSSGLSRLDRV